jgi:uncharacterized protein (DUF697 family)
LTSTEVIRLPRSHAELDAVVERCRRMVRKRAMASAGAVLVPLPGADIAADVALLTELIPAINAEFGLTPDQIESLNPRMKALVAKAIVAFGGAMVGRVITRELITRALLKVGVRVTAKTATRLVPIAGQAFAAGLSFAAMRTVGHAHIRDCQRVIEAILAARGETRRTAADGAARGEAREGEGDAEGGVVNAAKRLRSAAAKAASRLRRRPRA